MRATLKLSQPLDDPANAGRSVEIAVSADGQPDRTCPALVDGDYIQTASDAPLEIGETLTLPDGARRTVARRVARSVHGAIYQTAPAKADADKED